MTKIAIPPDLADMFAACEDAYQWATREGYADNPAVIAAVTALKSASAALHLANYNLKTAKGLFSVKFAVRRADRAFRATCEACINLHAAIGQAALEHRLNEQYVKRLAMEGERDPNPSSDGAPEGLLPATTWREAS